MTREKTPARLAAEEILNNLTSYDELQIIRVIERAILYAEKPLREALREGYEALAAVSGDIHDAADTDAAWERVDLAMGVMAKALGAK